MTYGDHRYVGPFSMNPPLSEGDCEGLIRHFVANAQHRGRCEDYYWVVVANRCCEKTVGVERRGWHDRLHPSVNEERVRMVRVLGRQAISRTRAGDYIGNRDLRLAARHESKLLSLINNLFERDVEECRD